jgi:hypothetical protein
MIDTDTSACPAQNEYRIVCVLHVSLIQQIPVQMLLLTSYSVFLPFAQQDP